MAITGQAYPLDFKNSKPCCSDSWFHKCALGFGPVNCTWQLQWPRREPKARKRTPFHVLLLVLLAVCGILMSTELSYTSVNIASGGNIQREFNVLSRREQSAEIREGIVSAPGNQQSVAVSGVKWSCFKADWAVTWTLHIPASSERGSMTMFAGL